MFYLRQSGPSGLRLPTHGYVKYARRACPVCNTAGHTARDCPQLTFAKNTPSVLLPASNKLEFCRIWNRKGSCFRGPSCRYLHACSEDILSNPVPSRVVSPHPVCKHRVHTPLRPQVFAQFYCTILIILSSPALFNPLPI